MFVATYRKLFMIISSALVIGPIVIVAVLGLKLSIDFTGGSLTEISYGTMPEKATVEEQLSQLELGGYSLRETINDSGRDGFILRTRDLTEADRVAVNAAVTSVGTDASVDRFTSIGPVIGEELKNKAVWAIGGVVLMIVLYVAFAFRGVSYPVGSWSYGGITILALIHDVAIPTALMAILGAVAGVEVDVLFVMAILAVLGYSVNDTIVVFDRIRENLVKYRQEKKKKVKIEGGLEREEVTYKLTKPFADIAGQSVQETMVRSVNTSLTTLLALLALYFIGSEVTATFAFVLIAGVVAGTYSSIFLASPLLIYLAERALAREAEEKA